MFQAVTNRTLLKYSQRIIGAFAGTTFLASFATATFYRPTLDRKDRSDYNRSDDIYNNKNTNINETSNRKDEYFISDQKALFTRNETPFLLSIAQHISIGVTTIAIRILMTTYGEYDIVNDKNYHHFLELVLGGNGRDDNQQGMITVSNHRSLFDDPGVVSCLLPLSIGIQPKYNRWGICSQEYCFTDKFPSFFKGYIGAGQVLPIRRGAGIDHVLLKDFSNFLAKGEWCHIFPEGGVWQSKELGGRGRDHQNNNNVNKSSKLRWGVGKLIAHASRRPRVIPFAHVGMENLLPQHPETGKTYFKKKIFGDEPLKVHVRFGEEIFFDDLIKAHEKVHGRLWVHDKNDTKWLSSDYEKELYKQITLRIEEHMEVLTKKVVCK